MTLIRKCSCLRKLQGLKELKDLTEVVALVKKKKKNSKEMCPKRKIFQTGLNINTFSFLFKILKEVNNKFIPLIVLLTF